MAEIDDRGVLETILDAYGEAGLRRHPRTTRQRTSRRSAAARWPPTRSGTALDRRQSQRNRPHHPRAVNFFYLVPSLGLLLLAPLLMAAGWRRRRLSPAEWSYALTCFAVFGIGAVSGACWSSATASTGPCSTSAATCFRSSGLAGAVAGLRAVFPRFAIYYVGLRRRSQPRALRAVAGSAAGQLLLAGWRMPWPAGLSVAAATRPGCPRGSTRPERAPPARRGARRPGQIGGQPRQACACGVDEGVGRGDVPPSGRPTARPPRLDHGVAAGGLEVVDDQVGVVDDAATVRVQP